jgi:hypothetical protein
MNLFVEREMYESQLIESKGLKKMCYIVAMLCMDDTALNLFGDWNQKTQEYDLNIDSILLLSEKNFFRADLDNLLGIFPHAEDVLDRSKFLEE